MSAQVRAVFHRSDEVPTDRSDEVFTGQRRSRRVKRSSPQVRKVFSHSSEEVPTSQRKSPKVREGIHRSRSSPQVRCLYRPEKFLRGQRSQVKEDLNRSEEDSTGQRSTPLIRGGLHRLEESPTDQRRSP